ncbi:MAG TPA: MogA/MoaB family molybdenum cofactor biosynthesis protein [Thermodesulfobacteriota bacterium]|nr:MogA/MoaB family molybdenum cofactor biosynthesis protein [Deltaproteobacteria bacterium]HNR11864.1 MogA/MoaB family molybdenum cofactor biosynthesis protein [Thermodesulfobacteriota bacterium]HNU70747.1 MogA/MoaB family molybdenum cofactor biosynthesis protein [Thermodesulfobacteriota bacterium]
MAFTVGIITISDKGSRGEREDLSGEEIKKLVSPLSASVVAYTIIPDEIPVIRETLIRFSDDNLDLIITTGGTGLSPRDVTPEATASVIEKEIRGMAEAMRLASMQKTPFGMLSRGIVGTRKNSLIVNLPGSPKAVRENLEVLLPVIPHTIEKLQGDPTECGKT